MLVSILICYSVLTSTRCAIGWAVVMRIIYKYIEIEILESPFIKFVCVSVNYVKMWIRRLLRHYKSKMEKK